MQQIWITLTLVLMIVTESFSSLPGSGVGQQAQPRLSAGANFCTARIGSGHVFSSTIMYHNIPLKKREDKQLHILPLSTVNVL